MNRDTHEGFITAVHKLGPCHLVPYSAGHAFALEAAGWKLSDLGTAAGVIRFANICSRPIGAACLPEGWPGKTGLRLSLWGVAIALLPRRKAEAVAVIHAYLADCLTTPHFERPQNEKDAPGLGGNDLLFRVIAGMRMGLSEHRCWSMPIGALNAYLLHRQKLDGREGEFEDEEAEASFAKHFENLKRHG